MQTHHLLNHRTLHLTRGFLLPRLKTSTGALLFGIMGLDAPGPGFTALEPGVDEEELELNFGISAAFTDGRPGGEEDV
jgi:hypothetical protein